MYFIWIIFLQCPLVEQLAEDKIFVAGTIKERAVGFPDSLIGLKLSKGDYASERVGDTCIML